MKLISRILILILACMMLLTSCETDEKKEENKPTATVEVTEAAKETAKETATIEPTMTIESTASIQPTESLPTTEATQTPETETTETPQATEAPTATTILTIQPTVTAKPTVAPTATVQPTENPNVDYYEWGKHGFERLLPIPLPFSDEEADWSSKKDTAKTYYVENRKRIKFGNAADFIKTFEEYVKSFKTYGYTVTCQNAYFTAQLRREQLFIFNCINGHVIITITLVS